MIYKLTLCPICGILFNWKQRTKWEVIKSWQRWWLGGCQNRGGGRVLGLLKRINCLANMWACMGREDGVLSLDQQVIKYHICCFWQPGILCNWYWHAFLLLWYKFPGLNRSGKSCRLRWVNYLRPGLKRGQLTPQEEGIIIELHALWGNK